MCFAGSRLASIYENIGNDLELISPSNLGTVRKICIYRDIFVTQAEVGEQVTWKFYPFLIISIVVKESYCESFLIDI